MVEPGQDEDLSTGRRLASARALAMLVAMAALVGVLGGLAGVAFRGAIDRLQALCTGSDGSILEAARALSWWQRLLLPALGGLVGGVIFHFAAWRETAYGLSDLMEVVSLRRREIHPLPTLGRVGASLAVIATGGSVGREGPIIQLGATVAELLGRWLRPGFGGDPRSRSILLGAGAAAGMAAAYNTPLAGAVFVMEVVLSNFAMDVFASVGTAAVASTLVMRFLLGEQRMYDVAEARLVGNGWSIAAALPLGVVCGGCAVLFQRMLQGAKAAFGRLTLHPVLKTGLGGLLVGVIGLKLPEVWGNGYQAVSELVHWQLALGTAALLIVMKPLATGCSIGSGGQGGVFTPAMFVGAALGALASGALNQVPGVTTSREALVFVGMGGLIAGITHAPIMSVLLLFEMTGRPALILPLIGCAAASALTAKLLARDSLYTESLRQRGVPVELGLEELALRQIKVGDLLRKGSETVREEASLEEIARRFAAGRFDYLYVVDAAQRLRGVVTLHDVKDLLNRDVEPGTRRMVIAADVMRKAPGLDPKSSIAEVLDAFDDPDLDELPVVERGPDGPVLVGHVTRRDLVATLNLEVLGRPAARAKFVIEGDERARYLELPRGYEIARLPVTKALAGRRLGDTGLRRNHRLVVLAIVRPDPEIGEQRIAFDPDFVLEEGEQLVVMGEHAEIERARAGGRTAH